MSQTILISTSSFGKMDRRPLDLLEQAGYTCRLNPYGRKLTEEEAIGLLQEVDGLIAGTEPLTARVLAEAPRLKVISRCGVGMDSVDVATAQARGIHVCNTPSAHVEAVAELTLGGLLALARSIPAGDARVRGGTWKKPMGWLLRGKTVGVVGLGQVGKVLVRLLQPFGVTVLATDPYPDVDFADAYDVRYVDLDVLLAEADVVTLHVPFSEANRYLLGRDELGRMKPGAVLVNTARGGLVDEEALYEALADGRLAGAYLDTFEKEPYGGALAELPNVVLTPHIGSYAAECRVRMETEAVENLLRYFEEAQRP